MTKKKQIHKLLWPIFALCAFFGGVAGVNSQVLVTVDPTQGWVGYMNVFELPTNGGGYDFGTSWGTAALQASFQTNGLVLAPCTNVWETSDTYWVQSDGVSPNKNMDANFYIQNDGLVNTNVIFAGKCVSNTLTNNPEPHTGVTYNTIAFIKLFDGNYNLIGEAATGLVPGQSFSISSSTVGATHVQYGFEVMGPDASPTEAPTLGTVVIAAAAPSAIVTVDPTQSWVGYMNVFNLPANGNGYQFGSSWATNALTAFFQGTNDLILMPCTNVWETNDTYWVQPDGVSPNKLMDASMYVQNDHLTNTNVIFIGTCISNTLSTSPEPHTGVTYSSVAFIKTFDNSFNLVGQAETPTLTNNQPFALSLNTVGASHVQYGFETIGPDANPATVGSLGNVEIAVAFPPVAAKVPTNALTPTRPPSKVLSMYNSSGVYTNHPVERWLATWSGAGFAYFPIPGTSRTVLKYTSLEYAGVEFYDTSSGDNAGGSTNYSINASGYDTFHVDVWTPDANQFGIQLVSLNPTEAAQVDFLPASGVITNNGWISLDIPLSTFMSNNPSTDFTDLQQLLWLDNESGGGYTGGTFYIDNVYFYTSTGTSGPILTVTRSGNSVQLSFPTQNGSNYTVQYKTHLTDATWQTLTTVAGNGSTQTVTDPATQSSRFYRLQVH